MGRNISTITSASDVAYAICNFSSVNGASYRLLDENFRPARRIPRLAPIAAPIAVSQYGSYGTVAPSGYGLAQNPVFALGGHWSGYANSTSNSIFYDGLIEQAIQYGGSYSPPSSSSSGSSNYTGRCGEFGHDLWNLDTSGAIQLPLRVGAYGIETKTELNDAFVNADLGDPSLAMLLWRGALYLVRRRDAEDVIVSGGLRGFLSKFVVPSLPAGFYGTASYNRARGELVIVGGSSESSSSGMWLRLYRNVPAITATTNINAVLSAMTPTQISLSWSGWTPAGNTESVGGCTPVLVDNGDVFLAFMNPGAALYVVRLPRSGDTTFGTMSNHVSYGVTTSYGRNSLRSSGMQVMQTRDGSTVAAYCQYYYYGAGLGVITLNKRSNSARVMYSDSDSYNGRSVLHWGQSGFAVAYNASYSYSAHGVGQVLGFDCSVQTASVSPAQFTLPIPNGYNTGAAYPFYVEVNV